MYERDFPGKEIIAAVQYGKEGEYWLKKFSGQLTKTSFPYDGKKTSRGKAVKDSVVFKLSKPCVSKLMELSKGLDHRLYIILTAGLVLLLHKYTGNKDIIIGTPIFKQERKGNFVNTVLALRNQWEEGITFKDFLLNCVRPTIMQANEHLNYPLETLLFQLNMPSGPGEFPLFDVVLLLENIHDKEYLGTIQPNVIFSFRRTREKGENGEPEEQVDGNVEYDTFLYQRDTIERIHSRYCYLLEQVLFDLDKDLTGIDILSGEEKSEILHRFGRGNREHEFIGNPGNKVLRELFEDQVEQRPDNTALIQPGESSRTDSRVSDIYNIYNNYSISVTYNRLNQMSDRLGHRLKAKGVEPDQIVGIVMEPGAGMIAAILAILKAGGAYLPIDPTYPPERIKFMLGDAGTGLLLTETIVLNRINFVFPGDIEILLTDHPAGDSIQEYTENLPRINQPGDAAYTIYTSGTTGKPKGSLVEHHNITSLMTSGKKLFNYGPHDIWTMFHSYCFDFSVWEMYGALLFGGKLLLIPRMMARDPWGFLEMLKTEKVTVLNQTPAAFYQLARQELKSQGTGLHLKYVIFGGDTLNPVILKPFKEKYPGTKLINMFGITETTVHVTFKEIHLKDIQANISNIGVPIPGLNTYIMDEQQKLKPIDIPGEICVGGQGVSRGYLNRPELTGEKFLKILYPEGNVKRLYRSGDMGRFRPGGDIEYMGRIDHQVKIRGFRVEPGEIQRQLLSHEKIKETAIIARNINGNRHGGNGNENRAGDMCSLCAYLVAVDSEKLSLTRLRDYLSEVLPDYMIPSYFVYLDEIPLTANGKVDRKALPDPAIMAGQEYEAPASEIEAKLVEIWSDILKIDPANISINSNFFELGGHSLKATIMTSQLHKELKIKLPLAEIFKTPTIRELARYIKSWQKDQYISVQPVEEKEYYPLSPAQKRLYFLQRLLTATTGYNMPYVIPMPESVEIEKPQRIFNKLIARHESFRTSFEIVNREPVQRIHKVIEFAVDYYETTEPEMEKIIAGFKKPFDLSRAPLLRASLLKVNNARQVLLVDMHHILTDGTAQEVLYKEFMTLFSEPGKELAPLRLQCRDYSEWQNSPHREELIKQQQEYWLRLFPAGAELPVLNLPLDYARPLVQDFDGKHVYFILNNRETKILKKSAREKEENDVTLYMYLLAVLNVLLFKLSGQEDIIVGTTIAARRHSDLQQIIGMLVNTLAMRNFPGAEKTFGDFLKEVRQQTLEAYENQEYPFEMLVDKIVVNRDTGRNPVFDVLLNLLNQSEYQGRMGEASDRPPYRHQEGASIFDMGFNVFDTGDTISFILEYSSKLFTPATIDRFITYFKNIISSLPEIMDKRLADIEILAEEEKQEILHLSPGIEMPRDKSQTIHRWFEKKVESIPTNTALVFGEKHLSYGVLNHRANSLAGMLIKKGVGPDFVVGLMVERSIEMIIALLAIMKAGGAYLPIDPGYPADRILFMLEDSSASIVLTIGSIIQRSTSNLLKKTNFHPPGAAPIITPPRKPIHDLDSLPVPDRSLVNYKKYHKYIASAMAKHTISILTSRGCPFGCIYCNKVFTGGYVTRSAENIFSEIKNCYDAGIRRFAIIDDVFNLDEKNASVVLNQLIKNRMDVQLFFSNGLRGDILTREFIDLMIEAGTVTICLALESASPRIQKLIKKNLNLEKFEENVRYITGKYPHIILEIELMHGFPTETEEEAMVTLDFLMDLKWVHFPDLHILKIYPHTNMYQLAVNHGISEKQIARSVNLAYHQIPETLPFTKDFTRGYQARFLNEYFFLKERLKQVLPYQAKVLSADELVQKYDSYLPMEIKCFPDILECMGLSMEELGDVELLQDDHRGAPDFSREIAGYFPKKKKRADAFRILLLDLSLSFTSESNDMLYDVVEAPLGLMYLLTYLNEKFAGQVCGKILKSRIDFDSFAEMRKLVMDFKPDLIGIRTLSLYKDFFHRSVLLIKQWGIDAPIVGGGPYATSEFASMLQDVNVDLAVLGEGELTLSDLIERMMANSNRFPGDEILKQINGIAFIKKEDKSLLKQLNRNWLLLDNLNQQLVQQPGDNLFPVMTGSDMAYVIYTSGSTGKPKGAVVEHRNLVNLFNYQFKYTDIDCSRILQFATISFDASFHEIFSAFLSGGQLYLVDQETRADVRDLFELIARHDIKTVFLPMSFLKLIFSEKDYINIIPRCIRHIQTAGEQVMISDNFKRYLRDKGVYLHNHYGPSETHVVTTLTIDPRENIPGVPSIGRPIGNTSIYLLEKSMNLVPVGVAGELYIGGIQVGRGYLNNPELTFDRFVNYKLQNTKYKQITNYNIQIKNKLYQTGDLARWHKDGNIEFLGRMDHQVKIRGFRIELGEIESQLLACAGVKEAVVVVKENNNAEKYLCAYVTGKELTEAALRKFLAKKLPDYMIPVNFVLLEHIPLTTSEKIDRDALPEPGLETNKDYLAPRDEIEKKLVEIWSDVLEVKKEFIGIDTNFFELGGHSLKSTNVIFQVNTLFNVNLPIVELFKTPYIRQIGEYIKKTVQEDNSRTIHDNQLVLLRQNPAKEGNIFLIHDGSGDVESYTELCNLLNTRFDYWGIRAARLKNYTPQNLSFTDITTDYLKKMKTVQPHGPYWIAGWSLGGRIAFEMALQLEKGGEQVSFVGLIDTPNPQFNRDEEYTPFSPETELNLILDYLPDNDLKQKLISVSIIDEIWPFIINYFEENNIGVETVNPLIPGKLMQIIPGYVHLGVRDLVYYLNIGRTLNRAWSNYIPGRKIKTGIHYFKAHGSPIEFREGWRAFCSKPIISYDIPGDHFSILKPGGVEQTMESFSNALMRNLKE